ncbi:MAG: hypothetical protein R3246_11785, partial [Acidimicrobiia bacterium]|nr:hypothetical protein [Acidimicrobiia bacterium]
PSARTAVQVAYIQWDGNFEPPATFEQRAFRMRGEGVALNTDGGWLAAQNADIFRQCHECIRIRTEVAASAAASQAFRWQYRINGGTWTNVYANPDPYDSIAATTDIPRPVQAVPAIDFADAAAITAALLTGGAGSFANGEATWDGITSVVTFAAAGRTELELSAELSKFYTADGATGTAAVLGDTTTVDFRVVKADGTPLDTYTAVPRVTVDSAGVVGGCWPETPDTLICEDSLGTRYTVGEYWESSGADGAKVVLQKSIDGGLTWTPMDIANNPANGDLEGASLVYDSAGKRLVLAHDVGGTVYVHEFRTSDHATSPDTWGTVDQVVGTYTEPAAPADQWVSIAYRPTQNDFVVASQGDSRNAELWHGTFGAWTGPIDIDTTGSEDCWFPTLRTGKNTGSGEEVHIVYATAGTGWAAPVAIRYKLFAANNTLTADGSRKTIIATGIDDGSEARNPIAGVAVNDLGGGSTALTVMYGVLSSLELYTVRTVDFGTPGAPALVTGTFDVESGLGSRSFFADLVADGVDLHAVFIRDPTGTPSPYGDADIYHNTNLANGGWDTPTQIVDVNWRGSGWVRAAKVGTDLCIIYDNGTARGTVPSGLGPDGVGGQGPIFTTTVSLGSAPIDETGREVSVAFSLDRTSSVVLAETPELTTTVTADDTATMVLVEAPELTATVTTDNTEAAVWVETPGLTAT